MSQTRPDPVTTSVIGASLISIVEEMSRVLIRAGYSTSIKERKDVSTALMDARGHILAQAAHQPMHLGSLLGITEEVLKVCPPEDLRPGDIFIGNDAYVGGGTHLNDITFIEPVFVDGKHVAWVTNIAHHADFVDRSHAHIFQEGLRIPPVRLYRAGVLQQDIVNLVLLNCQVPHERLNDFKAQRASNRFGCNRFIELCAKYGFETVSAAATLVLDHTEKRTRAGIARIPDGTYRASGLLDSGRYDEILELKVEVIVAGDEITLDFRGNPAQVRAPINLTYMGLLVSAYYAIMVLVDPDLPPNAGFHRPIRVLADEGTIVCSAPPAAVYSRTDTSERLCDLIFSALAPAMPQTSLAPCTGRGLLTFSGIDPRTGKFYVYNESMGGGEGAHIVQDGADAVQTAVSNSQNIPVEVVESEYPLQVVRYELVTDSGGAGTWRGGMGYRREIRAVDHEAKVAAAGNCFRDAGWGLDGGLPGMLGGRQTSPEGIKLPLGRGFLKAGESVAIHSSGGGGVGDPKARDPKLVARDLREGKVSAAAAERLYCVPLEAGEGK